MDGAFRPTEVPLFESSNVLLEPTAIYRNLDKPLLIIDPIKENDWLADFEATNNELASSNQTYIQHSTYEDTGHNVLAEDPDRLIDDIFKFLDDVYKK